MGVFATILLIFIVYCLFYYVPVRVDHIEPDDSLQSKADTDLAVMGDYGLKYEKSLGFLLYEIFVRLLLLYEVPLYTTQQALLHWQALQYDPEGVTLNVINNTYFKVVRIQEEAAKEDTTPEWHVDLNAPIPDASKTLRFNDHCDIDELIAVYKRLAQGGL